MTQSKNTAVVVVDPYNDFLSKKGMTWPVVKTVVKSTGMIGNSKAILKAARKSEMTVAYAPHHRYCESSFHGRKYLHPTQVAQRQTGIFSAGKFGGDFLSELAPAEGDIVSSEHMCSSGFAETDLHDQLQADGITHLIIVGMITNSCIEATARSAVDLGYHVTLVTDGVAAFSPVEHSTTIRENYPKIGHVVTNTASLLKTLGT